jgi:glycosyltransferase involved in cell wall biosynthesis
MTVEISVLMPVYNTARYLHSALTSIAEQTFRNFELLVTDDGSTDESARILKEFGSTEPRMRVVRRANRGIVATRNELLEQASGEFLAWMDSDDVAVPERLARQLAEFRRNPALVCVGGAALCVDPDDMPLHVERFPLTDTDIKAGQWEGGGMRFPTTMMRTATALEVGGFRAPFAIGEDLDFLMRLGERGALGNLNDVLLRYRLHPAGTSFRLGEQWEEHLDAIRALADERRRTGTDTLERTGKLDKLISRRHDEPVPAYDLHVRWARLALSNGYVQTARKHARAALQLSPWSGFAWRTWLLTLLNIQ